MCEDNSSDPLDRSIRDTVADMLLPGDVVVSWVAIAGVRHVEGGGTVVTVCSDDSPPLWQLRGMLAEAEAGISRNQLVTELDQSTEE